MSFNELRDLIQQLITSWEIIAITIVVLFYFSLIARVSRRRYKIKTSSTVRGRKKIKKVPHKVTPTATEEHLADDDLGIEEEK
jgi:hypothetical protein